MYLVQCQQVSLWRSLLLIELCPLQFASVSVETVSLLVANLVVHKAAATNGLLPQFFKASPYMVRLITDKCIASSSVPDQWKWAVVTPVPKCKHCTSLSHF